MGTAPENKQAAYVHQTSLVCVIRRGERLPRARSLANFTFALDGTRRNAGDGMTRTAALLILKNCEIARASARARACHRRTTLNVKEALS
jgi:hypothetical protein